MLESPRLPQPLRGFAMTVSTIGALRGLAMTLATLFGSSLAAQVKHQVDKPPEAPKDSAAYVRLAETGGPLGVAKGAGIVRFEPNGIAHELRKSTNGFTCSILLEVTADPYCADKNAWQFMVDLLAKNPKPTNNEPGIAYMAAGGTHLE